MIEECDSLGNKLSLENYGEFGTVKKIVPFVATTMCLFIFKSTKAVFNMQGA